jgi:hypothetical protein
VAVYLATLAPRVKATMPEIPAPSSRTVELEERQALAKRKLVGEAIHSAKSGVTFHTTAPVVPPVRSEVSRPRDWWMSRSQPATVSSMAEACESMKPRDWEGISWEKTTKAS